MNIRLASPLSFLMLSMLAAPAPAPAQDGATLRREIETALARAAETGTLLDDGRGTTLRSEARVRYELGAVVDVRSAGTGGLPVLAVTPGSAASRLDLRAGDRLLAINGRNVNAGGSGALQQAIDAGNGKLAVQWLRAGKRLAAQDQADAVAVPNIV